MLDRAADTPAGVVGLVANGTVIAQDVSQALAAVDPRGEKRGLIVFVDPDFDGYLSELVSGLDKASSAASPMFQRWALVVPDGVLDEARLHRGGAVLKIFPRSRRDEACAFAQGA
jgi:hypothetical protein